MYPFSVVEHEIFIRAPAGFTDSQVLMKVNLFIFDRSPEMFHKDVVINPAPAIHADKNVLALQYSRKIVAGKPGALIRFRGVLYQIMVGNFVSLDNLVKIAQKVGVGQHDPFRKAGCTA